MPRKNYYWNNKEVRVFLGILIFFQGPKSLTIKFDLSLMEQPNDEMSLELRLSHSFKHQISVKVLSYFWFLKRRCCGFIHLPFPTFGKLESFWFLFQNFGKNFSKNWKNSFQKIGEQFWKPSNFSKFVKGRWMKPVSLNLFLTLSLGRIIVTISKTSSPFSIFLDVLCWEEMLIV